MMDDICPDLFRTMFHTLRIDPEHEHWHNTLNRPIPLVEGGEVVGEVLA